MVFFIFILLKNSIPGGDECRNNCSNPSKFAYGTAYRPEILFCQGEFRPQKRAVVGWLFAGVQFINSVKKPLGVNLENKALFLQKRKALFYKDASIKKNPTMRFLSNTTPCPFPLLDSGCKRPTKTLKFIAIPVKKKF